MRRPLSALVILGLGLSASGCAQIVLGVFLATDDGGGSSGGGGPPISTGGGGTASFTAAISPASGPTTGGTLLQITLLTPGVTFGSTPSIAIGGVSATDVRVIDPTHAEARTPPRAQGNLSGDAAIEIRVGSFVSNNASFSYQAVPPTVVSVSPVNGPTSGGTAVGISGTGFAGAMSVRFGATPAASVFVNGPTQLLAVTQPMAAGTVDVVVTHPSGSSATLGAAFTYQGPPPPPPPPPPGMPANMFAVRGRESAMLSWDPLSGATSYTVHRGTAPGVLPGGPGVVSTAGVTTPHLVSGLVAGVTYYWVVTATTPAGEVGPSTEVSVTPLSAGPAPGAAHALPPAFSSINDMRVDRVRWRAYCADENTNELVVFDLASETEIARRPLSIGTRMLSLSPSLRYLVVVCNAGGFGDDSGDLYLFDPENITQTALYTVATDCFDVEMLDDGLTFIPSWTDNDIQVYDALTGAFRGTWGGVFNRTTVNRTPDQRRIYATHLFGSPPEIFGWRVPSGMNQSVPNPDVTIAPPGTPIGSDVFINADGTRLMNVAGRLFAIGEGPGGATISASPIHTFAEATRACQADSPGVMYGLDSNTGELIRYDLVGLTTQRLPGYDTAAFGLPRGVLLGPGGTLLGVTTLQRIVVIPEPP